MSVLRSSTSCWVPAGSPPDRPLAKGSAYFLLSAYLNERHLRGKSYKLRPFIDARLARHPLQTEDASPLLYRLSALYSFVRQSLEGKAKESLSFSEDQAGAEGFTSHKCTSCYHYH